MRTVGRRRLTKPGLPLGVTEDAGVWYWYPPTLRERAERRRLKQEARARGERFTIGATLGPAGSPEARRKWAEVSGFADRKEDAGKVAELLRLWERDPNGLPLQPNGEPRAESTVENYRGSIEPLLKKFGQCAYGKTEAEAAAGVAIGTATIQTWVDEFEAKGMMKRYFHVLNNAFAFAVRRGKTTYNPCQDVALPLQAAREREPMAWEVECLRTMAGPRMGLMMDFESITGWRIGDLRSLKRAQGVPEGVRMRQRKRGKRWMWEWTPELERIWRESVTLPFATPFPASPVFPSNRRGHLSEKGFDGEWQGLKRRTNAVLAEGVIDPGTLQGAPGLVIEDLHFHDLRSKAYDDAEDAGMEGHDLLGNSRAVGRKHYHRRERKVRALR